jgi:hypothetical protein
MKPSIAALAAALLCTTCLGSAARAAEALPSWLRIGPHTVYDGQSDDLVNGGLGAEAMLGKRPGDADPLHPTPAAPRSSSRAVPARVLAVCSGPTWTTPPAPGCPTRGISAAGVCG